MRELCNELCEQYERKNHDYGNSFEQSLDEFGLVAGVCRIGDKYNRIKQLIKGSEQKVKDEAIEDTLMDMATYCLMCIDWLKKQQ